jgi:hypothetical protein
VSKSQQDTSGGISRPTAASVISDLSPQASSQAFVPTTTSSPLRPSTPHSALETHTTCKILTGCTRERNHQRSPHARNHTAAIRHDTSPRRIASICHHQTGRRQTELIRGLECSRARTVLRSAECFHAQERQKTQKTGKVPSLASQKATTCCPLAIVAEGRSATFSSRALHLCITARRISIRLLRDLNLFVLTLHYRGYCPVSYTPALPVCRQGAC